MNKHTEATFNWIMNRFPVQGYITLTMIHPDKRYSSPSHHHAWDDIDGIMASVQAMWDTQERGYGYGAFFGVATRKADLGRYKRGGVDELGSLSYLYADIDQPPDIVEKRLATFRPMPTMAVSTGRGVHLYWRLRNPTSDWPAVQTRLAALANVLGGDTMTPPQALRIPGFINTKPGNGHKVAMLWEELHREYNLSQFDEIRPPERPERKAASYTPNSGEDWLTVLKRRITDELMLNYDGRYKSNGWMAAICPCGHSHDKAGCHFNWHPEYGVGRCFGRHGKLLAKDLKAAMRL